VVWLVSMDLESIANRCIEYFRETFETSIPLTKPSIPILYFGDLPSYMKSEIKLITVGLNPSHNEFPKNNRFARFKKAENLDPSKPLNKQDMQLYLGSLNDYYKEDPYNWFGCFEPILNGLQASYYPSKYPNNALHTDICSPFATNVTWSNLSQGYRRVLAGEGSYLWRTLVEFLKPDMILISVAREHLQKIRFRKSRWKTCTSIHRKKDDSLRSQPYKVEVADFSINGKKGRLVFGQAAQLPFGTLSTDDKEIVGEKLLNLI